MLRTRVIPALLLQDQVLVKTTNFKKPRYIGDPINTCRIFNELEVDELCFLDIAASEEKRSPNFEILREISSECFMPLSYGGGISELKDVEEVFKIGFEKVVLNTATFTKPHLIAEICKIYGAQAVVASVDVRKNFWGIYQVYGKHGMINQKESPVTWSKKMEDLGVGELLLTNIDREGTWLGFDQQLIREVSTSCKVPVIAHGGAGSIRDIGLAVSAGASAVALGSMIVYQQKGMGVLVNFPDRKELELVLNPSNG